MPILLTATTGGAQACQRDTQQGQGGRLGNGNSAFPFEESHMADLADVVDTGFRKVNDGIAQRVYVFIQKVAKVARVIIVFARFYQEILRSVALEKQGIDVVSSVYQFPGAF